MELTEEHVELFRQMRRESFEALVRFSEWYCYEQPFWWQIPPQQFPMFKTKSELQGAQSVVGSEASP